MRSGALLALSALWQAAALQEIQPFEIDPDALSNIELLIPLLVSDQGEQSERNERTQESRAEEDDERYSAIPAYAFTLDETFAPVAPVPVPAVPPGPAVPSVRMPAAPPVPGGSRKRDLSRVRYDRARSLYLERDSSDSSDTSDTSDDRAERDVWRACSRLAQRGAAPAVLLYLCAELLDVARPYRARAQTACACCARHEDEEETDPPWFGPVGGRRDLMPLGDTPNNVEYYLHAKRTRPRPWWLSLYHSTHAP